MLSGDSVANVLHALATGFPDRAVNVVAMSDEIDEAASVRVLWTALTSSHDRSDAGPAIRGRAAVARRSASLVNECYRVRLLLGRGLEDAVGNPLFAYFAGEPRRPAAGQVGPLLPDLRPPSRGVSRIARARCWRSASIAAVASRCSPLLRPTGADRRHRHRRGGADRRGAAHVVEIGDQEDPEFLASVVERHGPFDIVIDDGGHTMRQQILSVETLFPLLADGGVYIVEDCHTSYWARVRATRTIPAATFVGWVKDRIDDLHAYHHSTGARPPGPWQTTWRRSTPTTASSSWTRRERFAPFSEMSGTSDYINTDRETSIDERGADRNATGRVDRAREAEEDAAGRVDEAETPTAALESPGTRSRGRGAR